MLLQAFNLNNNIRCSTRVSPFLVWLGAQASFPQLHRLRIRRPVQVGRPFLHHPYSPIEVGRAVAGMPIRIELAMRELVPFERRTEVQG